MESMYYYIHSIDTQNEIIIMLKKYFEKRDTKWFFIRYWYGGPHLRVRFSNSNCKQEILQIFKSFEKKINRVREMSSEEYYRNHTFDGEKIDYELLPWYLQGEIVEETYEPECHRYGKDLVLMKNEQIFQTSSEIIGTLIEMGSSMQVRLIYAYFLLKHVIDTIGSVEDKTSFLEQYYVYWKNFKQSENQKLNLSNLETYVERIEHQLNNQKLKMLLEKLDNQLLQLKSSVNDSSTFYYMLSSQIHMTNNRLSVPPWVEGELANFMRGQQQGR